MLSRLPRHRRDQSDRSSAMGLLVTWLIVIAVLDEQSCAAVRSCPVVSDESCPTLEGSGPNGEIQQQDKQCMSNSNFCKFSHLAPDGARCSCMKSAESGLKYEATDRPKDQYPRAPVDVNARYYNYKLNSAQCTVHGALNITWKPPADGSVTWLHGFLLNITRSSMQGSLSILRTFNLSGLTAASASDFLIVFDCFKVLQFASYEIRLSSLPRSPDDTNTVSIRLPPINHNNCSYRSYCYQSLAIIKSEGSTVTITFETFPPHFGFNGYTGQLTLSTKSRDFRHENISTVNGTGAADIVFKDVRPGTYSFLVRPDRNQCCYENGINKQCSAHTELQSINVLSTLESSSSTESINVGINSTPLKHKAAPMAVTQSTLSEDDGGRLEADETVEAIVGEASSVLTSRAVEDGHSKFDPFYTAAVILSSMIAMALLILIAVVTRRHRLRLLGGRAQAFSAKHRSAPVRAQPNDSSSELTAGLIRSSTSRTGFSSRLLIACDGGHGYVSTGPIMARVHRLLGKLLYERCRCEVRIACNSDQSAVADTNNNDGGRHDGPSALVVIHPTPPPLQNNGRAFDSWRIGQRWKSSLVGSPLAVWIGLERVVDKGDEFDDGSFRIYHVYFREPGRQEVLDVNRIENCRGMSPMNRNLCIIPPDPISYDELISITLTEFSERVHQLNYEYDYSCGAAADDDDVDDDQQSQPPPSDLSDVYELMSEIERLCADICYRFQTAAGSEIELKIENELTSASATADGRMEARIYLPSMEHLDDNGLPSNASPAAEGWPDSLTTCSGKLESSIDVKDNRSSEHAT